jgi:hypothetical protein
MTSPILAAYTGVLHREPHRARPDLSDCYFYHIYNLSDGSTVCGPGAAYDIRGRFDEYIGGFDLNGKTVFDFGTASGFLTFSAEKAGGRVTAFETRSFYYQDRVPHDDYLYVTDKVAWAVELDGGFKRMHNSWWYMWHDFKSRAEIVYGSLEDLILTKEKFDVVIAGAVMEHIGDPITAIGILARLAKEAIIIAFTPVFLDQDEYMKPLVPWTSQQNSFVWWGISKGLYDRVLANLGFEVEYHSVVFDLVEGKERTAIPRQTIVARRKKKS